MKKIRYYLQYKYPFIPGWRTDWKPYNTQKELKTEYKDKLKTCRSLHYRILKKTIIVKTSIIKL